MKTGNENRQPVVWSSRRGILNQSDILIAVWDEKDSHGRAARTNSARSAAKCIPVCLDHGPHPKNGKWDSLL
jgi:hypothetical protein